MSVESRITRRCDRCGATVAIGQINVFPDGWGLAVIPAGSDYTMVDGRRIAVEPQLEVDACVSCIRVLREAWKK